jgi:hypothetical protein
MVDFTKIDISRYDEIRSAVVVRDSAKLIEIGKEYNLFTTCCTTAQLSLQIFNIYLQEYYNEAQQRKALQQ